MKLKHSDEITLGSKLEETKVRILTLFQDAAETAASKSDPTLIGDTWIL